MTKEEAVANAGKKAIMRNEGFTEEGILWTPQNQEEIDKYYADPRQDAYVHVVGGIPAYPRKHPLELTELAPEEE